MFENVNYTYYHDTMERSIVPDEATFNSLKDESVLYGEMLAPFITERVENGLDKAVNMMIEERYKASVAGTENGQKVTSESISGYSYSYDNSEVKGVDALCSKWLRLYCRINPLR